jgi:hypothetical protein
LASASAGLSTALTADGDEIISGFAKVESYPVKDKDVAGSPIWKSLRWPLVSEAARLHIIQRLRVFG